MGEEEGGGGCFAKNYSRVGIARDNYNEWVDMSI